MGAWTAKVQGGLVELEFPWSTDGVWCAWQPMVIGVAG